MQGAGCRLLCQAMRGGTIDVAPTGRGEFESHSRVAGERWSRRPFTPCPSTKEVRRVLGIGTAPASHWLGVPVHTLTRREPRSHDARAVTLRRRAAPTPVGLANDPLPSFRHVEVSGPGLRVAMGVLWRRRLDPRAPCRARWFVRFLFAAGPAGRSLWPLTHLGPGSARHGRPPRRHYGFSLSLLSVASQFGSLSPPRVLIRRAWLTAA